jgi:hypothetical protein
VNIWVKPFKFELALAIYTLSLALYARFLPDALPARRWFRVYVAVVAIAIIGEMLWVGGAAMAGIASHFNREIPLMATLYSVMGVLALILTSASLVFGIAIWRNRPGAPAALRLGLGLGLVATTVLTVLSASYLASGSGHTVGATTGAPGLWLMGWSREAGDLRVAHFFATHAMHALPLAGLAALRLRPAQGRTLVLAVAAGWLALVGATLWQAIRGQPFLPGLG